MPYVGNPLANAFSSREKQDLTGQSGTSFTLTHSVSHANDLSVYINHVRQEPTTAYSVNGTTLTTTGSVAGTDDFYIIYDELAVQSISHPTDQALTATSGTFTSGLVGTTGTFSGAISGTLGTAAQPNVTSVGTLTGLTTSGDIDVQGNDIILDADNDTSIVASTDDQIDFKAGNKVRGSVNTTGLQVGGTSYFASPTLTFFDADSGVQTGVIGGRINFHTNDGTAQGVSAKIQAKYENANSNTSLSFETGSGGSTTEKMTLASGGDLTVRNSSTTGTTLTLGTSSTSVSNGGYIGGLMFTGGSANTATARIQALSNGQTDAGATGTGADFSFECRNNNASFTEKFLIKGSGDISIQKNTSGFGNITSFGTVTLADDASITITSGTHTGGANHLYVYETATGSNCVYYGGYNKTAVLTNNYLETGGIGFASSNSDGNVSFYSDGAHSLTFQNREGSSKTFKLMKVGVGATFNDTA